MAKARYSAPSGAITLTASTAKTGLFVMAPSTFGIDLVKFEVSFNSIATGDQPVKVEICTLTGASNVTPGTGNTTVTVVQTSGRAITAGFTAGANCSSEPTVLAAINTFYVSPLGVPYVYDYPLGTSPDNDVSKGFAIRLTPGASTSASPFLTAWLERC
jgi:hypothetical protein